MISKYSDFIEELLQLLSIPLAPNGVVVFLAVAITLVAHEHLRPIKRLLAHAARRRAISSSVHVAISVVPASG